MSGQSLHRSQSNAASGLDGSHHYDDRSDCQYPVSIGGSHDLDRKSRSDESQFGKVGFRRQSLLAPDDNNDIDEGCLRDNPSSRKKKRR